MDVFLRFILEDCSQVMFSVATDCMQTISKFHRQTFDMGLNKSATCMLRTVKTASRNIVLFKSYNSFSCKTDDFLENNFVFYLIRPCFIIQQL